MQLDSLLPLPAGSTLRQIQSDGATLAVLDVTPQGEIAGVVQLVHGFTGSKEDFWDLIPLLVTEGYRVIAHDHRGHNQSLPVATSEYSIEHFADDIIAIQDELGITSTHLLGHSLGGMISRLAVLRHSNRFDSFTLFCTGPDASRDTSRYQNLSNFINEKTMHEVWQQLVAQPDSDIAFGPSDSWPAHKKQRWLNSDAAAIIATVNIIATEPDRTEKLSSIDMPFHSVYGEFDDVWSPEKQDEVAHRIGAPISVITACGHCPNEDDPKATAKALIEFWNTSSS